MLTLYRNTFSSIVCNINVQTCVAEISRCLSLAHKRLQAALAALAVALIVFAPLAAEAAPKKKIGVLFWSQESRYHLANKGFVDQMAKEGFDGSSVQYIMENAQGDKAKAMAAAERFSAMKLDMVIALGTTAAVVAAKTIKDIPVIVNNVYDPVDAKIAESWSRPGNNVTGSSPKYPMLKLVGALKQFAPVKKLAVLYTPGEKNSETQLRELQELSGDNLKIEPVPLTRAEDVAAMMPEVLRTCDAVYLSGSSIAGASAGLISNMATRAKIPTITHSEDLIPKGVLLGVCADPVTVGALAGKKAAKVLNGASPASVPIEAPKKLEVVINMRPIKAEGIKVPKEFLNSVTKIIE